MSFNENMDFRKYPRSYNLSLIANFLSILHEAPIPFSAITRRYMKAKLESKKISKRNYNAITKWKVKHGIDITDIAEYFYLMRDLEILRTRTIDREVDLILPLGGDGPALGDLLKISERMSIQYLSPIGEKLYKYLINGDTIWYNSYLFWLILKNKSYYPYIQDIIENPKSYRKTDVNTLLLTRDSVSANCIKNWGKFFGIFEHTKEGLLINLEKIGRYILSSSVIELNNFVRKDVTLYIKELVSHLSETFRINSSAIDFVRIIKIIFEKADRNIISGFTSGRGDLGFYNYDNIQILKISANPSISISKVFPHETVKFFIYALDKKIGL
jgi:hypothetical protein